MTTQEAFDKLKAEFPGRNVSAWNWIPNDGIPRFSIDVDTSSCRARSFENCFAELSVKSREETANEKRAAAQKLIEEANALISVADQIAPVPAGEAVAS